MGHPCSVCLCGGVGVGGKGGVKTMVLAPRCDWVEGGVSLVVTADGVLPQPETS
jgi:hypothetical protein